MKLRSIARLMQTICFWSGIFQMIIGAAGCGDNPEWAVSRFITSVILMGIWAFIGYVISVRDDRADSRREAEIVRRVYKKWEGRDEDLIDENIGIKIPGFMR